MAKWMCFVVSKATNRLVPLLRRGPDFLIIGAQKGGTTSLHAYLQEHPQIRPSTGPKELHFFNLYYNKGLAWYLSHFPWRFQARAELTFEATPDYICHKVVPLRIREHLGRPKLILTLREPAERAYSAWKMWHNFVDHPTKARKADRRCFTTAIQEELTSPNGQSNLHFHYVTMGRYAEHIENFLQHFPEADLLILDFRDMSTDLHGFLNQICSFLGIDEFSEEECDRFGKTHHWAGPQRRRSPEEEATLAELRKYYAPHNEKLFELLGRRLDWQ